LTLLISSGRNAWLNYWVRSFPDSRPPNLMGKTSDYQSKGSLFL